VPPWIWAKQNTTGNASAYCMTKALQGNINVCGGSNNASFGDDNAVAQLQNENLVRRIQGYGQFSGVGFKKSNDNSLSKDERSILKNIPDQIRYYKNSYTNQSEDEKKDVTK
jgi:hypothetical protein